MRANPNITAAAAAAAAAVLLIAAAMTLWSLWCSNNPLRENQVPPTTSSHLQPNHGWTEETRAATTEDPRTALRTPRTGLRAEDRYWLLQHVQNAANIRKWHLRETGGNHMLAVPHHDLEIARQINENPLEFVNLTAPRLESVRVPTTDPVLLRLNMSSTNTERLEKALLAVGLILLAAAISLLGLRQIRRPRQSAPELDPTGQVPRQIPG